MNPIALTRRELLSAACAAPLALAAEADGLLLRYLEGLSRPGGGYGWASDPHAHLTPTFAVLACYHLLGKQPPAKAEIARFVREHYPMNPARHKDRPLRRFDYEQIQSLAWLGEDASAFLEAVRGWTGPSVYTKAYEHEGNPVFQHEVMALLCRPLLGIPAATPEWKAYILPRRRANGSFNSTSRRRGRRRPHHEHLVGPAGAPGAWRTRRRRRRTHRVAPRLPATLGRLHLAAQTSAGAGGRRRLHLGRPALPRGAGRKTRPAERMRRLASLAAQSRRRLRRPAGPRVQPGGHLLLPRRPAPGRRKASRLAAETPRAQAAPERPEALHHSD